MPQMKLAQTIFAVLLCFVGAFAQAAKAPIEFPATSGNAFVRVCSGIDKEASTDLELQDGALCIGYVQGVREGVIVGIAFVKATSQTEPPPKPFCLPDN